MYDALKIHAASRPRLYNLPAVRRLVSYRSFGIADMAGRSPGPKSNRRTMTLNLAAIMRAKRHMEDADRALREFQERPGSKDDGGTFARLLAEERKAIDGFLALLSNKPLSP